MALAYQSVFASCHILILEFHTRGSSTLSPLRVNLSHMSANVPNDELSSIINVHVVPV